MKRIFYFFPFLILIFWVGCTDDPNDVGIGMLPPQDNLTLQKFETTAINATTYLQRITGISARLMFGKTGTLQTRSLLQFSGTPTQWNSSFVLDTAWLRFPINYRFMDSIGRFSVNLKQLLRGWSKDSLRWDSTNSPSLVNSTSDTLFQKDILPSDSLIEIPVNSFVRKWFADTLASPYGMMISPEPNCTIILGCPTTSYPTDERPELYVVYHTVTDPTLQHLSYRPFQETFFADAVQPTTSDSLFFIQAGLSYRGKLNFALDSIPKRASITKASLDLTLNPNSAFTIRNAYSTNTIVAHIAHNTDTLSLLTASATFANDTTYTLSLDVKALLQQIVSKKPDYEFILRSSGDYISLDRYAFYGITASDSTKRPRLNITYTILP